MVLRVKPTPTRFLTNSLFDPDGQHTLAVYVKCVPPVGLKVSFRESGRKLPAEKCRQTTGVISTNRPGSLTSCVANTMGKMIYNRLYNLAGTRQLDIPVDLEMCVRLEIILLNEA